jgi:hypothetical protein
MSAPKGAPTRDHARWRRPRRPCSNYAALNTCKVTYTTAGSFKIKAAYSGDGAFARSTSKALTETVNT